MIFLKTQANFVPRDRVYVVLTLADHAVYAYDVAVFVDYHSAVQYSNEVENTYDGLRCHVLIRDAYTHTQGDDIC